MIRVVRVSGTIKKAEQEGIRRAKEEIRLVRRLEMEEEARRRVSVGTVGLGCEV